MAGMGGKLTLGVSAFPSVAAPSRSNRHAELVRDQWVCTAPQKKVEKLSMLTHRRVVCWSVTHVTDGVYILTGG